MAKKPSSDVSIGKFDVLAAYAYAEALRHGLSDDDAKQRGIVAAMMGAHARLSIPHHGEFRADKDAAERKKKTPITAASFDHQVRDKPGSFFDEEFLPMMKRFVEAGSSYNDSKRAIQIPSTWGTKISAAEFRERAAEAFAT
jgi:hypothetical protein